MAHILSLDKIKHIEQTLQETGSVTATAQRMGVSRNTVYNIRSRVLQGDRQERQEQQELVQGSKAYTYYLALKRSYENRLVGAMNSIPLTGFEFQALHSHRAGKLEFLVDADGAEPEFVKEAFQDNLNACMALLGVQCDVTIQYRNGRVMMSPGNLQAKAFLEAYKIALGRECC